VIGSFRYDPATNQAMILAHRGSNRSIDVLVSAIGFDANGPSAAPLGPRISILDMNLLPFPADLLAAGWTGGYSANQPWMSPDGRQILFVRGFRDVSGTQFVFTVWVCDLSYDAAGRIQPIQVGTCREVHRGLQGDDSVAWGGVPGTIYITQPSSADSAQDSLYRLTLQPAPSLALVQEVFSDAGIFTRVRVTSAVAGPDVSNGELVALYKDRDPQGCNKGIVIDAYDCNGLSCRILNQKSMRHVTWLPDGRLAGVRQDSPDRKRRCSQHPALVAFPGIDPNDVAPIDEITPLPVSPYFSCGECMEGSGGGW
jgi:hypothetical protein